jgi:uroporphyrin-III C-methyltransferase/precorrin-2 dehydrogenase/sirohydrochlorin ferrochelatase
MRSFVWLRRLLRGCLPDRGGREELWRLLLDGPDLAVDTRKSRTGHAPAAATPPVALVGAGPGDPELLTLRALRLIRQADDIVYDHLVGNGILELAAATAKHHYVGKQSSRHTLAQEQINALLVRLATEGRRVVRLKGGDPFIFGRGGEEIEALQLHGVRFEVVPGITAASGMSCYAGIPLTHRDYAHTCVLATGHLQDEGVDLDWKALARPAQTVVVYMGMAALGEICRQLVRHGLPAATPAAVVQQATTAEQRVVSGSLETLPHLARAAGMKAPALIVIGEVVKLRRKLEWFAPREVAIPRSQPQAHLG